MLKDATSFSSYAVDDLEKAKHFYGSILQLDFEEKAMGPGLLELHPAGGGRILIYPKQDHVPATFTVLNFEVSDIKKTVADLERDGVKFIDYDMQQLKTDDDHIFRGGGPVIAWFNDPAGNILSVVERG